MTESFKQYGIKLVILISNAASFFAQICVQKIWHNLLHTQDDSCAESVSFLFAWQQQQQQQRKQHLTIQRHQNQRF